MNRSALSASSWKGAVRARRGSGRATSRKSTLRLMRAIGLSFAVVLLAVTCAALWADAHSEVLELLGNTASALADYNVPKFMESFDKEMPDYDKLKDSATALTNQAEVTSAIELV